MSITPGRTTHGHRGELVVFLIGLRLNRWWRPDLWVPAFLAMPPMLRELYAAKAAAERGEGEDPGFLGARSFVGAGGPMVVQYWRSTDDLYRYAADPEAKHRPAWRAFHARSRRVPGGVGVWHETYAVPAKGHESVYVDMPPVGLAGVTSSVPVGRRGERAAERLAS